MTTRRAGQSARENARAKFQENPVRSVAARLLGVHTDERAWREGAKGEERLARRLTKLSVSEWLVSHDISLGSSGWNVDHLLIGTRGIFAINTKNLSGKVTITSRGIRVNGFSQPYFHVARSEAKNVGARLSEAVGRPIKVVPALAVYCNEWEQKSSPKDILVRRASDFPSCLDEFPTIMEMREISPIVRAAKQANIWRADRKVSKKPIPTGTVPPPSPPPRISPPPPPPPSAQRLVATKWKRYGKERLYFKTLEGEQIGFIDLQTNEVVPQEPHYRPILESEADAWLKANGGRAQ